MTTDTLAADPNICDDFAIDTVEIEVFHTLDNRVAASAQRACSFHGLTVKNVPSGTSLYVVCKGVVNQQVLWQGTVSDIILSAGESRNLGTISMGYTGNDQTPPQVVTTYPVSDDTNVDINTDIVVVFNEPLAPSSVSDEAILLTHDGGSVAGDVSYNPTTYTIRFRPEELIPATDYMITLQAGAGSFITDTAGNALTSDINWLFTTDRMGVDNTPPQIIIMAPSSDNARLDSAILATFNEPMDPNSFGSGTLTVMSDQGSIDGPVVYDAEARTLSMQPNAPMQPVTLYTVTISTNARDLNGNALAAPVQWTFRTVTPRHRLTVLKNGTGTVTSTPAGIDCGATCSGDFDEGDTITLTAVEAIDSIFSGWAGSGCSGESVCQLQINADSSVTANFERAYTATATTSSGGTITADAEKIKHGGSQTFHITADAGYYLSALLVDGVTITSDPLPSDYTFDDITVDDHTIEAQFQLVRYVDLNATVTAQTDGKQWQTAYNGVQDSIDSCSDALQIDQEADHCEVWVVQGTYHIYQTNHYNTVRLRPHVEVYGGFTGSETTLTARDWLANPTVLDGREDESSSNRLHHIITCETAGVLDGFTVQNSYCNDLTYMTGGGGMLNLEGSAPVIRNTSFRYNDSSSYFGGGAMNNQKDVVVTLFNCTFTNNSAAVGGAVYNGEGVQLTADQCDFQDNRGLENGGAIYSKPLAHTVFTDSAFISNRSAQFGSGGAINSDNGYLELNNCDFSSNTSNNSGGAVYTVGANASMMVRSCTFSENFADLDPRDAEGGAIYFSGSNISIANSRFDGNHITTYDTAHGGAVAIEDCSNATITNSVFFNNALNSVETFGGAVYSRNSTLTVTNCTLYQNSALSTGGTNRGGGVYADGGTPSIGNSIIRDNTPDELRGVSSLNYGITFSNITYGEDYFGCIDVPIETCLVSPSAGVFRMKAGSPCIDAANGDIAPLTDFEGNPRYNDPNTPNTGSGTPGYVDMGAFEYQGQN